ncbi:MAG: serine hydrolase domain-containing protein [Planctomycetota bacterium]
MTAVTETDFAVAFPRAHAAVAGDRDAGQHSGMQLYVSRDGEVLADVAVGEDRPGEPLGRERLMCWLSAGKPATAVAVLRLIELGRFGLDTPVVKVVPEFAGGGKEAITVRHLLTHTAGIRNVEHGYPDVAWGETVARVCAASVEDGWVVGQSAGYHVASSWFVLGEVVRRAGGRAVEDFVRDEVLVPGGAGESRLAWRAEELDAVRPRVAAVYQRTGKTVSPLDWATDTRLTRASPGSSLRGPVADLGRFYERLLAVLGGDASGPVSPETARLMTTRHRAGVFDETFKRVLDMGLGIFVRTDPAGQGPVPYGFGAHASDAAFGHGGAQSAIGFADPRHGLVVAWAVNTRIGEPRHAARNHAFNTAIYEDLGLGE